jgi:hypothetical protein
MKFKAMRDNITQKKHYVRGDVADFKECPSHHWIAAHKELPDLTTPRLGAKIGSGSPKGEPMKSPGKGSEGSEE